ncbi:MAG: YqhG family protein [Syntrophothermus sp.]
MPEIRDFVLRYYRLAGAEVQESPEGLVQVTVSDELAREWEGPWARGYQLELIFDPALNERFPQAELVSQGSYRLDTVISAARQRGRFSRQYLSVAEDDRQTRSRLIGHLKENGYPESSVYFLDSERELLPYLLVNFRIMRVSEEKQDELISLGINMVTGHIQEGFMQKLAGFTLDPDPPEGKEPLAECRRRISWKKAYEKLCDRVRERLDNSDHNWAIAARQRLTAELQKLEEYYVEMSREIGPEESGQEDFAQIRQRRLAEQESRFAPRVLIRPYQAAMIYAPAQRFRVLLSNGLRDQRATLLYDPLAQFPILEV